MTEHALQGYLTAAASACAFGSFAVPIKSRAVVQAKVDPIVFQAYKSIAGLIVSFVTLIWVDAAFTPWGLLGAAMWVFNGIMAIVAINHAGMGISQSLWAGLSSIVAFGWGSVIFHEHIHNLLLSLLGLTIMTAGIAGLGLAAVHGLTSSDQPRKGALKAVEHSPLNVTADSAAELRAAPHGISDGQTGSADAHDEEHQPILPDHSSALTLEVSSTEGSLSEPVKQGTEGERDSDKSQRGRFLFGVLCASIVGVSAGSFLVPFKYATDIKGAQYILSFGIGAIVASSASIAVYFPFLYFTGRSVPSFEVKVAAAPALLAGTLWSTGNLLSILAIDALGLAVGYPLIQCQIIISNLWAMLYYHELQTSLASWSFFISTLVLLGGVWLLAYYGT